MVVRNILLANGAMVLTQTIFGVGNVVAFIYLDGNPIVFALIREAIAGPLLLGLAFIVPILTRSCSCKDASTNNENENPHGRSGTAVKALTEAAVECDREGVRDPSQLQGHAVGGVDAELQRQSQQKPACAFFVKWYILCGLFLFGCNFCYIVGLKLAGALSAGIWQPSQPIITGAAGLILGIERFYWLKFFGIIIAVSGCAFHVLWPELTSPANATNSSGGDVSDNLVLLGNACLFLNCFSISMFYVFQKKLLKFHSPILVLGISYAVATVFMCAAALLCNNIPVMLAIVCPDCQNQSAWEIPASDMVGILYWVIAGSIGGYFFFSWANQYIEASLVAAYTALQPVTTGIATYLALVCCRHAC
eukprot:INCI6802.3.p1 GENE.INCI6802.3~~INCI6802.3.p1  ORF type:complete len:364 (-),score=42.30 INCI6802.3:70-1161(-)